MNILFTCAGRRNFLLECFKKSMTDEDNIFAADASPMASALHEADKSFALPLLKDPNYVNSLLELCIKESVDAVISLNDLELPTLAEQKEKFAQHGITLIVSSSEVVDICFDKGKTYDFFLENEIGSPKTYLKQQDALTAIKEGELEFPLIVKPRWGTASIGVELVDSLDELKLAYALLRLRLKKSILADVSETDFDSSILIQECIQAPEYNLDIINDLNGNYCSTIVKQKCLIKGGDADHTKTVIIPELIECGEKIGKALAHIGNLDCDVFFDGTKCFGLELNARFGGSYPFSHVSGANLPLAIISWLKNEEVRPEYLKTGNNVYSVKCERWFAVP